MNEISLLVVVPLPDPVDILVPSGTMLQVIVAGAPFPDREPDAVESHVSGSFGAMMNPRAGVDAKSTQESATADVYLDNRQLTETISLRKRIAGNFVPARYAKAD
jgi:hypothetical protein